MLKHADSEVMQQNCRLHTVQFYVSSHLYMTNAST
jgi:hypothetical protein